MKVSLRRAVRHIDHEKAKKTRRDVKGQVYEAWGVTNESRTGLYCLLFLRPAAAAYRSKPSIHEEATFVGYFLKQFAYEDAMGKKRWAPLLIGRLALARKLDESSAQRRQRNEGIVLLAVASSLPERLSCLVLRGNGLVRPPC